MTANRERQMVTVCREGENERPLGSASTGCASTDAEGEERR